MALTAIMKTTHNCNLACKYCYANKANKGMMASNTILNAINKVAIYNGKKKKSHFIWHGGEPLLMGLNFYEQVVEIENKLREQQYPISNSLQTNGTLLTDDMLDFLISNEFIVGLSLDGPKQIHDENRKDKEGKGSFDKVMAAINKMKNKGIKPSVLTVLNKKNISKIDELYNFFKVINVNIKLNPLELYTSEINEFTIKPEEYGNALVRLFDRWLYDENSDMVVEPFEIILGNLITHEAFGCQFKHTCQFDFISIGPQGDVYPCGKFDGEVRFELGNINHDDMDSIDNHPIRQELRRRKFENVENCSSCNFRKICNSGCLYDAVMMKGDIYRKDYYCPSYKKLFRHIEKRLHIELNKVERGKKNEEN